VPCRPACPRQASTLRGLPPPRHPLILGAPAPQTPRLGAAAPQTSPRGGGTPTGGSGGGNPQIEAGVPVGPRDGPAQISPFRAGLGVCHSKPLARVHVNAPGEGCTRSESIRFKCAVFASETSAETRSETGAFVSSLRAQDQGCNLIWRTFALGPHCAEMALALGKWHAHQNSGISHRDAGRSRKSSTYGLQTGPIGLQTRPEGGWEGTKPHTSLVVDA
jgi:hypothetical protein